jgi:cell division septal protein FtsQ
MTIDQRLAERRREVAEDRARRKIGRLVRLLIAVGLVGTAAWLLFSPLLSVDEVTTIGIRVSTAHSVLVEHDVIAGTPMILIRPEEIETALESDPWIGEAVVDLDWPGRVVVRIEEREPTAWIETGEGWVRFAVDGVQLSSAPEPDSSLPWIDLGPVAGGDERGSRRLLGSLEFAAALPAELREGSRVRVEADGELWAEVAGFQVRLGRAVEMTAKALSLAALIREQPAAGSILTLIAPTHPAVSPP